jgi:hypothetical protein
LAKQAIKSFQGGSETLLSVLWTSHITSFDSIASSLEVRVFASVPANQRKVVIDGEEVSLEDLFLDFLKGTGVPQQAAFDEARSLGLISADIDAAQLENPAFRPRMFHVAATGSDCVQQGEHVMVCSFC